MKSPSSSRSKPYRYRSRTWGVWLCCALGLVFALGPILHGLFHLGGLPHQHPSASVHHHAHGHAGSSARHAADHHSHGDSSVDARSEGEHAHSSHPHRHGVSDESSEVSDALSDDANDRHDESSKRDPEKPDPKTPNREPSNPEGPLFVILELDASGSIVLDTEIERAAPDVDDVPLVHRCVCLEPEWGSIGPRGPPA